MKSSLVYPSVGFYFQVKVENETYSFKEVSGITAEVETEEIAEGGENRFKFKVPKVAKNNNLELKRGLILENSNLMNWISESLDMGLSNTIKPKTIEVSLLNENGDIVMSWTFTGAWPIAFSSSSLSAMNNEILIESIHLSYKYFTIQMVNL